jgi:hypothetical protein
MLGSVRRAVYGLIIAVNGGRPQAKTVSTIKLATKFRTWLGDRQNQIYLNR